jgi:hypothetical protein
MEFQQETAEKDVLSPLREVTPLSKYLALVLFAILPFLGGYIGYTYAPEKIVEVEKVSITPKEDTSTTVSSPEITAEETLEKTASEKFSYTDNDISIAFTLNDEFVVEKNDLHTQFLIKSKNNADDYYVNLMIEPTIDEDGIKHCYLELCEKKNLESFPASTEEWSYLGESSYSDAGNNSVYPHAYRMTVGNYNAFAISYKGALHSEENPLHDIITTFEFEELK